jgi:YVTN family beta-propeller protein
VRFAVALQARLGTEMQVDPSLPLNVGIGLDVGEAMNVEGGYRGGALNLAARLSAIAGPGEVLASESVVHLARKVEHVRYVPHRRVRLKGIAEAVRPIAVVSERAPPAAARDSGTGIRRRVGGRALGLVVFGVVTVALGLGLVFARGESESLRPLRANAAASLGVGSGRLGPSVTVGTRPLGITSYAHAVWVTNSGDGTVSRIDPDTRDVVDTIDVGSAPSGVAGGYGSVWVANTGTGTVTRLDARNDRRV